MLKTSLVAATHTNCDLIQHTLEGCVRNARKLYGDAAVDKVTNVFVEYFDKGRDAAIAAIGHDKITNKLVAVLQFSMYATVHDIGQMLTDIVPHEYAHILCMANGWDDGHGEKWRVVCLALGGTGETKNNFATVDGRLKNLHEALCDEGHAYWLTGKQLKIAKSTGIMVRDAAGRDFTLTKRNITGNIRRL